MVCHTSGIDKVRRILYACRRLQKWFIMNKCLFLDICFFLPGWRRLGWTCFFVLFGLLFFLLQERPPGILAYRKGPGAEQEPLPGAPES